MVDGGGKKEEATAVPQASEVRGFELIGRSRVSVLLALRKASDKI